MSCFSVTTKRYRDGSAVKVRSYGPGMADSKEHVCANCGWPLASDEVMAGWKLCGGDICQKEDKIDES